MDLSKKELEEELKAINESIEAHNQQMTLHKALLRREKFLKELVEKELNRLIIPVKS
jgi:hypothetical protein